MANETTNNDHQNQNILPQVPKKPTRFKGIVWSVGGFILVGLAILYVASSVISTTKAPKNQASSSPTGSDVIPGFSGQANTAASTLKETDTKLREIQGMWANARGPLPMVCNAEARDTLRGRHWVVPATAYGNPEQEYICTDQNKWELVQPKLTDAQESANQRAKNVDSRGSGEHIPTAAEIYAYKAHEAFKSDSVEVHFSDAEGTGNAAAAKREGDALIQSANEERIPSQGQPVSASPQSHETTDEEIYPWDIYVGQKYRVFEKTIIEGILINRIEGEFGGPLKVLITNDVYALDKSTLLIPQGTVIVGSAGSSHSSAQRRLMIDPSRMIMPDGYCVRLEKVIGADQQGATGLTGKVDTHWKSLIATAVILGAIEGLGTGSSIGGSGFGVVQISAGMNRQTAEEGTQILNQQMNRVSSIRVYEGTPMRFWVGEDLLLPAWENHQVPRNL